LLRRRYRFHQPHAGFGVRTSGGHSVAEAHARVDVNSASAEHLAKLPVIGRVLAARIVDERRRRGAFHSAAELAARVSGLGPANVAGLEGLLEFTADGRPAVPVIAGEFEGDFSAAINLRCGPGALAELLEELAVFVASPRHPATVAGHKRDDLEPGALGSARALPLRASEVHLLTDRSYYETLLRLAGAAETAIDVCMFYIAVGGDDHPTRRLIDILGQRVAAGCRVRALVDHDRDDDPYDSRIVNSKAERLLSERGIAVRHDQADTLLHSKFVVIDRKWLLIGSHNWTAGSFMTYDDVSLGIADAAIADEWTRRFDELWQHSIQSGR
jgi:phosphatidylserine/phosphatidylglycerophosphate/cardiolipin synthase-like enzyme